MGMVISYQLENPYLIGDLYDYPEMMHPLIELETMVPGSWYINGVAKLLLKEAELKAKEKSR